MRVAVVLLAFALACGCSQKSEQPNTVNLDAAKAEVDSKSRVELFKEADEVLALSERALKYHPTPEQASNIIDLSSHAIGMEYETRIEWRMQDLRDVKRKLEAIMQSEAGP